VASEIRGARHGGTVRLTIPAAVANDIGSLKKELVSFAERLGCRTCFSGADCFFQLERDFLVDGEQQVMQSPGLRVELNPQPLPPGMVLVRMDKEVSLDIERLGGAIDRIVGALGCKTCCSGFDIFFQQEVEFINVDKNMNVAAFGV